MGQIATTIDEQIHRLENRGMIIPDLEKAKEHLLDIGYYRLGFYWYYFEKDKKHNFYDFTNLDDIIDLYYLDVDLKNLLLKYIYRIEVHFRTQLIYHASNNYPSNPHWYSISEIVDNKVVHQICKSYKTLTFKNEIIKKHHIKYPKDKYAPAWKTLEFLTFGQILNIYSSLKDQNLKRVISNSYQLRDPKLLTDYITSILNIRNICSHSNVLFDYNQPKGINRIPNKNYRIISRNTTNLNASFKLILFLLSKISINRANELEVLFYNKINEAKHNEKLKNIIDTHINLDLTKNVVNLYNKSAPLYILL
ncbi:Abi family protein [Paenimyroides ceti]